MLPYNDKNRGSGAGGQRGRLQQVVAKSKTKEDKNVRRSDSGCEPPSNEGRE